MTDTEHTTREAWLNAAVEVLRSPLSQVGAKVPEKLAVSVGFGARNARKALGVCFASSAGDGIPHLFISPVMIDPVAVLATLVHELIHASDDGVSNHRGHFARCAKSIGLEGKMTATHAGPVLADILREIATELGEYPHKQLTLTGVTRKQTTRLLKATCSDGVQCPLADESGNAYTIRVTRKWLAFGLPSCPCGSTMKEDV